MTADFISFLVYCVYVEVNNIVYSALCLPGSHLVPHQPDVCLHQHVCGHGLLRNLLCGDGLSEVCSSSFTHVEIMAVCQ